MSVLTTLLMAAAAAVAAAAQAATGDIDQAAAPVIENTVEVQADDPAGVTLRTVDPDPTPLVCPFRGSIDYDPGAVECGLITVPENREKPDSRLIQLHYVRIAAWGEDEADHRDDPVIYLTGGPGVGVGIYAARLKEHSVAEHRDLYILEQRGIGTSTDFCEQYASVAPAQTAATTMLEMEIAEAERMRRCFREAAAQGIDLSGYNTVENARDVKALREALGFDDWNVWGISYGSHLGQMLLREDPDGVRAIVLDAIVPNDLNGLFNYGRIFSKVVANFAGMCEGVAYCADLEARLWSAMESLRDDPLILEIEESEAFPSGKQWVPPAIVAFLPFSMAYEQSAYPAVPAVINALADFAETRDPRIIEGVEAVLAEPGGGGGGVTVSQGMSNAIRCNDGYRAEALAAYTKTPPGRWDGVLGTREGLAYAARVCEEEGLAPRDRADYALVQSAVPTLIVNGAWDPVTPPWLAEYIHEAMPGSRLIITPYAGHGPTRSMPDCAGPVMTAFFDDPDLDALDATCLEEGEKAPEVAKLTPTVAPFLAAGLAADAPQSYAGPALWLGLPLFILMIGTVMIPMGFFGRLMSPAPSSTIKAGAPGARLVAWLAGLAALAGFGMIGAGAYVSSEYSETALLAGLAAPAPTGMWLVLVSGLLGLASLVLLIRAKTNGAGIRFGTLVGLPMMALAAAALAAFALTWDLGPF